MMKLPLIAVATLLLSGTAALAQTAPAAHPTVAAKTVTKTTTKPAAAPTKTTVTTTKTTPPTTTVKATTKARSRTTTTTGTGRMVQAKLANGKTVTYNCSLAGNKTKAACK